MKTFSRDFRSGLANAASIPLKKLCMPCRNVPENADMTPMYALALAARVSYASDVATQDLGWALPWNHAYVVHTVPVPTEADTVRVMAGVDTHRFGQNFQTVWPNPLFERWCQDIALRLLEQHVPEGLTYDEAKAALDTQLRLRWADADFHTCGRSATPAVKRIVDGYEKAWR